MELRERIFVCSVAVAVTAALVMWGGGHAFAQTPSSQDGFGVTVDQATGSENALEAPHATVHPAEPEQDPAINSEREPPPVPPAAPHDPRGTQEWLEPAEEEARRFALGVGAGLVDAGPTTEPYFMGSLRIRFGQREDRAGGLGGYLEPEVGYWKRSALGLSERDFLVGVNVGGLVQLRSVSYFVAAGVGLHFIDIDRLGIDDDTTSLGVNVQFGVDVHVNPSLSLFGVGRIDLVEEWDDETQAKIYLGLRFHF